MAMITEISTQMVIATWVQKNVEGMAGWYATAATPPNGHVRPRPPRPPWRWLP
jgi:hypothetical protein